jgi:peptide/nickel transport system substrate-binding protein
MALPCPTPPGWKAFASTTALRLGAACALLWAATAAQSQTLKVVMHSDLKVMDPLVSTAYISRNHGFLIFDQLVARDAKGVVRPQMADKWETSKDGLSWTFTLRDGLEWHDGTPVTAEDCVASIRRYAQRDATGLRLAAMVDGYDVLSPKVFRIRLKTPYGLLLDALSKPSLSPLLMMPAKVAATSPAEPLKPEQMIGSGPFIFKRDEWKPGEKVVYVRNPKYRPRAEPPSGLAGGKVAHLERVEWIAISDSQTALAALNRGEVDMVEILANDLVPVARQNRSLIVEPLWQQTYFFRPNWLHPPFDNPKVRQAAMVALNQVQMLKGMVGDPQSFKPCYSVYACNSPYYTESGMSGMVRGDVKRAQALLKEAGYDGTPVLIPHTTDLPVLNNLGPLAKQQLERAGFKVQLIAGDWQSMVGRLRKKDKPADGGWNAYLSSLDLADAQNPIDRGHFNTDCKTSLLGWPCDAKLEQMRDAFSRTDDPAARKGLAREIQERNADIGAFVPLGEYSAVAARSNKLEIVFKQPITVFWGIKKKP